MMNQEAPRVAGIFGGDAIARSVMSSMFPIGVATT